MRHFTKDGSRLILTTMLLPLAIFLMASCTATRNQAPLTSGSNQLGLPPASLPNYKPGTKFVYSNGTWETVMEAGSEQVTWINHRGNQSSGYPDFTYKRHTWKTRDRQGTRSFNQTDFWLQEATKTLWPLKPGNKTRYDEIGWWSSSSGVERGYDSYWSCEVMGTERISVVAGDFDTWKITCRRYPDKFRANRKTREYRTWYYAPSINHWVLEVRDYNGYRENRRKELAAILPDLSSFATADDEVAFMKKQFQNTLETSPRGTTDIWQNPHTQLYVSMTPKNSFRLENGNVCRQYHQKIGRGGDTYEFPGIACRTGEGRWTVPRR